MVCGVGIFLCFYATFCAYLCSVYFCVVCSGYFTGKGSTFKIKGAHIINQLALLSHVSNYQEVSYFHNASKYYSPDSYT
jgi:hypothetical protein